MPSVDCETSDSNNSFEMKLKEFHCNLQNAFEVESRWRIEVKGKELNHQELKNGIFLHQMPELLSEISASSVESGSLIAEDL
ncbi:hypothetical protein TNCV_1184832 [Trichonephila clavipes]|nr:hypothetical protein TNCV_1184832 [Trichonephila clavipes]